MLYRSTISTLQGAMNQDESESLQADVMRFMAILGLCLMVIFALVQSLPSVSESREEARNREAEKAALSVEIAELRYQLRALSTRNREANEQMLQYEQTVEQLHAQVQDNQAVDARIAELAEQRDQLLEEQSRNEQQLSTLQEQLQVQDSELAALKAQMDSKPTSEEPRSVEKPTPTSTETPVEDGDSEPSEPTETPEEAEGFRLAFASNEAFFQLVKSAEISVFVITPENHGFKLEGSADRFLPAQLPTAFQDITRASLPPSLLTVLSRQRLSRQSRWVVALSDRVLQSINQAQGSASGGTLSIEGSGDVKLR